MLNIRIANPATASAISMEVCWRVSVRFMAPRIGHNGSRRCAPLHIAAGEKALPGVPTMHNAAQHELAAPLRLRI
jgi:hypothetical protein